MDEEAVARAYRRDQQHIDLRTGAALVRARGQAAAVVDAHHPKLHGVVAARDAAVEVRDAGRQGLAHPITLPLSSSMALSKIDEEEAHATLALLRGMGRDFDDAIEELKGSVIG